VATDGLDRYGSGKNDMRREYGVVERTEAVGRGHGLFHGKPTDNTWDGTAENRARWHNLQYYTWVEQQGRTVEELNAQLDPAWWEDHQQRVSEINERLVEYRQGHPVTA